MVVKVYLSGISGNKEVKKRQQRVLMILESKNVKYETIDITEPGKELEKEFMQSKSTARDSKHPLPPQIFNEKEYCGDYEDFDLANETDELETFLKITPAISTAEITPHNKLQLKDIQRNGNTSSRESSMDNDATMVQPESLQKRRSLIIEENQSKESDPVELDNAEDTSMLSQTRLHGNDIKDASEIDADQIKNSDDKGEKKSDEQEKEE